MTKLASMCVHGHKGGQSWYLAMPKDGLAPRVAIYAISTRHPAYLDPCCWVHRRVQVGAREWITKLARTRVQAHKGGQS